MNTGRLVLSHLLRISSVNLLRFCSSLGRLALSHWLLISKNLANLSQNLTCTEKYIQKFGTYEQNFICTGS